MEILAQALSTSFSTGRSIELDEIILEHKIETREDLERAINEVLPSILHEALEKAGAKVIRIERKDEISEYEALCEYNSQKLRINFKLEPWWRIKIDHDELVIHLRHITITRES